MAMKFELIDFGSIDKVAGQLKKLSTNARFTKSVLEAILLDMLAVEEKVFHGQGRRGGGSWKRLKEDTIRKKGDTRIFYTEGANPGYSSIGENALVRSLTKKDAAYQISHVDNSNLIFGTERPYAGVHQSGSAKRNIPARPFLTFTQNDMNRWTTMIEAHLVRGFGD